MLPLQEFGWLTIDNVMIRFAYFALLGFAVSTTVQGDENPVLQASIETINSAAWTISGFSSTLELAPAGLSGEFQMARIAFPESGQVIEDVRVSCTLISLTSRSLECAKAIIAMTLPGLGRQIIPGAFTYDRDASLATIELSRVAVAGGRVKCNISASERGVDVNYSGTGMQLGGLLALANQFTDTFSGYSANGIIEVTGTLAARNDDPLQIAVVANLDQASLANDTGTIAADAVRGRLDLDLALDAGTTGVTFTFESNEGEAYLEPVYANFSEHAFRLQAKDVVTTDFEDFEVRRFVLQQDALLDASGSALLGIPADADATIRITADVELRDSAVSNLYESLVQIQLAGTLLGDLEAGGRLSGSISVVENSLRAATLQLDDLIVDDRSGRFAIYGLHGLFDWRADEGDVPAVSRLRWDSGTAYNIIIGGGEASMQLGDNDIELLVPLRLPTMGGALLINQLALQNVGTDEATGILDAELEPIQLAQLTGAFGWLAFSGTLSGRLPLLQLAEDAVTVGGTLSARAFDGTMEISKLRIEQPFGLVPRLQGEVALRDLDLQRVTEAFSFGLIQGRLSGEIAGLEMQSWRPVAMDMHFYTPTDDKSQHRISQRAVENLASVGGGGAAAVLSTGFLRFFEVFAYDRIGLRCVLRDATCAMSGVGPAKQGPQGTGYYIVKGRGIPRIDVVGYRDTVSWPRLVRQLAAITRSGSPTVN